MPEPTNHRAEAEHWRALAITSVGEGAEGFAQAEALIGILSALLAEANPVGRMILRRTSVAGGYPSGDTPADQITPHPDALRPSPPHDDETDAQQDRWAPGRPPPLSPTDGPAFGKGECGYTWHLPNDLHAEHACAFMGTHPPPHRCRICGDVKFPAPSAPPLSPSEG